METGGATPNVSAPATPGTPGAPLFNAAARVDSLSYDRKSMPRCNKCIPLDSWASPQCFSDHMPKLPDISLTRKVTSFIYIYPFLY